MFMAHVGFHSRLAIKMRIEKGKAALSGNFKTLKLLNELLKFDEV